jgi:hypothetical protein
MHTTIYTTVHQTVPRVRRRIGVPNESRLSRLRRAGGV